MLIACLLALKHTLSLSLFAPALKCGNKCFPSCSRPQFCSRTCLQIEQIARATWGQRVGWHDNWTVSPANGSSSLMAKVPEWIDRSRKQPSSACIPARRTWHEGGRRRRGSQPERRFDVMLFWYSTSGYVDLVGRSIDTSSDRKCRALGKNAGIGQKLIIY